MGYTRGIQWNDDLIEKGIKDIIIALNIDRMPSCHEIINIAHDSKLVGAICKHGGYKNWAERLGLEIKKSETLFGKRYETALNSMLTAEGYKVEQMVMCHPYDLLVNDNIKIDVKSSKRYYYTEKGYSYSFNLEKNNPTCDLYVCFCIDKNNVIEKVLVIPSKFLKQTQLCIGINSKYDVYINRWDYIKIYDDFYTKLQ